MRAIFTYHSIDSSGSPISLSEESFRSHMRFFGSGRVRVVPLAELASLPDETEAIALTFDDGFLNFTSSALPLLSQHGFPATVFVVSDAVGGTNEWGGRKTAGIPTLSLMSWADLARVQEKGLAIGAHTRTHPWLTAVPAGQLDDEVGGSAERIRAELGTRPSQFAYPYGDVNEDVARAARGAFEVSVTTELRMVESVDDRALLPRLDAWYFQKSGLLESWGSARFRRYVWLRAQGRRVRSLMAAGGARR